jgi:hypothetical protein
MRRGAHHGREILSTGLRREMNDDQYDAAWHWLQAMEGYSQFWSMFLLWHRNPIRLSICEKRIIVDSSHNNDKAYEAHTRVIRRTPSPDPSINQPGDALLTLLVSQTAVGDTWFRANFNAQGAADYGVAGNGWHGLSIGGLGGAAPSSLMGHPMKREV